MTGTTNFLWDDVATESDPTVDRRVIPGEGGSLKRVAIAAGTVAPQHEHEFEQFFLVQEGTGSLTCASGEIRLKPGVVIHFEPNTWHSAIFETDTVLVEINFSSR